MKKKRQKKNYFPWIIIVILALAVYSLAQNSITGNVVKDDKVIIYFPEITDFPNNQEGTMTLNFGFPEASFKVGEKQADVLMFIKSKTIPGLQIGYYPKERKLRAGLPVLETGEVSIIDGKNHQIMYSFSRKDNKQGIFLDGKLLVDGEFTGEKNTMLGGAVVYQKERWIKSDLDISFAFS